MKNYTITVNGSVYDVTVEENGAATQSTVAAPAKKAAPEKKAAPVQASGSAGSIEVNAPMPGKILDIKASVGASVKKGDVILLLEAMKMENEVVAPEDGKVASINVTSGAEVTAGEVLATLE